jgi:YVTN family beta-propeller protein
MLIKACCHIEINPAFSVNDISAVLPVDNRLTVEFQQAINSPYIQNNDIKFDGERMKTTKTLRNRCIFLVSLFFGFLLIAQSANALNTVIATITVGTQPIDVAFSPDGTYTYVSNTLSQSLSVVNITTNTVIATISIPGSPFSAAFTPNGAYAYAADYTYDTVRVINTNTRSVTASIPVGNQPSDVALAPNGGYAYVTNQADDSVSVINTTTNTVTSVISVGDFPNQVALSPDGAYAYVANEGGNSLENKHSNELSCHNYTP